MGKRVVDLSIDDLEKLAGSAFRAAVQKALARGLPVTGSVGGRRFRYHPDGRVEDLGPVAQLPDAANEKTKTKAAKRSSA